MLFRVIAFTIQSLSIFPTFVIFFTLFLTYQTNFVKCTSNRNNADILEDHLTLEESGKITSCFTQRSFEIVFLIETSFVASGKINFNQVKDFLKLVVETLDVRYIWNNLDIITFGQSNVRSIFTNRCEDYICIWNAIENIQLKEGNKTQLSVGLEHVRNVYFTEYEVTQRKLNHIPFFLVIFTDQEIFPNDVMITSAFIRQSATSTFLITRSVSHSSLQEKIVSKPVKEHLYLSTGVNFLGRNAASFVTSTMCKELAEERMLPSVENRTNKSKMFETSDLSSVPNMMANSPRQSLKVQSSFERCSRVRREVDARNRTPRLFDELILSSSAIAPPSPPLNPGVKTLMKGRIVISWNPPEDLIFDSFLLVTISILGQKVATVEGDVTNVRNRTYNLTVSDLKPGTRYRFNIYTRYKGVLSQEHANTVHTEQLHLSQIQNFTFRPQNSLLMATEDGIYLHSLDPTESRDEDDSNTQQPQRILHVPTGVVDAKYYRRETITEGDDHSRAGTSLVWIDRASHSIKWSRISNSVETNTFIEGLVLPTSLAIDFVDDNVYWSDMGSQVLGVASLKSTTLFHHRLVHGSGMVAPVSVAIDPFDRQLYWGDLIGRIESSRLDGTERRILINDSELRPYGLTVCTLSHRLYWVNSRNGMLETLSGGRRTPLYEHGSFEGTSSAIYLASLENSLITMSSADSIMTEIDKPSISKTSNSVTLSATATTQNNFTDFPTVLSISTFDYLAHEIAIVDGNGNTTSACSYKNGGCREVCISTTSNAHSCTGQCHAWEVLCDRRISVCVNSLLLCDGVEDCPNGEDERPPHCDATNFDPLVTGTAINRDKFQCRSGHTLMAIENMCDGRLNCRDGSDEETCPWQEQVCNFEEDLCLWSQDFDDDFDWTFGFGRTLSKHTGPVHDHTLVDTNGSYIYIEATSQDSGAVAKLKSVWLAKPVCVDFYYHMFGAHIGSLALQYQMRNSSQTVEIWKRNGNQGYFWNHAQVSINEHTLYQLLFVAVRGEDYRGDIAIDDVAIRDGLCEASRDCSFDQFDETQCGYELESDGEKGWELRSGSPGAVQGNKSISKKANSTNPLDLLGPGWIYFEFDYDAIDGCNDCNGTRLVRTLTSHRRPKFVGVVLCNTTHYKIYLADGLREVFRNVADAAGKGEDHCEFLGSSMDAIEIGSVHSCRGNVSYGRSWWAEPPRLHPFGYPGTIYLSPTYYRCDITFPQSVIDNDPHVRGKYQPNRYIYADANEMGPHHTATLTIPVYKGSESVVRSNCTHDINDTRRETHSSVSTPSNIDQHAFQHWCLTFKYFVFGENSKSIYLKINENITLWSEERNFQLDWKVATVTIPSPVIKYDLHLIATTSFSLDGGFAVDDVTIRQEPCVLPTKYVCHFTSPNVDYCSFTIDQSSTDKLEYIEKLQESPAAFQPLILEHSIQPTGILNFTGHHDENVPLITSPLLPPLNYLHSAFCLILSYKPKLNKGNLRIVLKSNRTGEKILISNHRFTQTHYNAWMVFGTEINGTIEFVKNDHFQIEIYGLESVYLDEISLETQTCPTRNEGHCNNGLYCGVGVCVEPRQLCDGVNDCGNWLDEIGCSSHCGTVSDLIGDQNLLVNGTENELFENIRCIWRIHGSKGKSILININEDATVTKRFTLDVYGGLPNQKLEFSQSSNPSYKEGLLLSKGAFHYEPMFIFNETEATVVLTFEKKSLFRFGIISDVTIQSFLVQDDYCSFVCDNRRCITGNHECDGVVGCLDESDEKNCTRINEELDEKIFEIRKLDGEYAALCADDVTSDVADIACQQMGFERAEEPLTFVPLLQGHELPHRIQFSLTETGLHRLQPFIQSRRQSTGVGCRSGKVWVANCVPFRCGISSPFPPRAVLRIVGGFSAAREGKWPWAVSFLNGPHPVCGGTLISSRLILTAAHCFDLNYDYEILLGSNNLITLNRGARKLKIKRKIIHSQYNENATIPDYDVALVELDHEVTFSRYISPACIPDGEILFRPGKRCRVIGFGHLMEFGMNPHRIQEARTPILPHQRCANLYPNELSRRMLCTGYPARGGVGICNGDSGGPLLCKSKRSWFVTGVVSWSYGCALVNHPDVYTNVQYFTEWIATNAGLNLTTPERYKRGTCGGTFRRTSGSFSSPGWPENYPNGKICVYRILMSRGQTLRLVFQTFQTRQNHDYIEVYRSGYHPSNLYGNYSGTISGLSMEIENTSLEIVFFSGYGSTNAGFHARWIIQGRKQNYTGSAYSLITVADSSGLPSSMDVLSTFVGLYHPILPVLGSRPTFVKKIMTNNRSEEIKMYYDEKYGNWKIYNTGRTAWMLCNDSSDSPDKVKADWMLVFDNGRYFRLDLRFERFSDIESTSNPAQTWPITSNSSLPSTTCNFLLTNRSGNISLDDSILIASCQWSLIPSTNLSHPGFNWIVLFVENIEEDDVIRIYRGRNVTADPIYLLNGTLGTDENEHEEIGSASPPTPNTSDIRFSQLDCTTAIIRYLNNPCFAELSLIVAGANGSEAFIDCPFITRCADVSWCNVLTRLQSLPQPINLSILLEVAASFCYSANYDTLENTNSMAMQANSSTSKKLILTYRDTDGLGLTLLYRNIGTVRDISRFVIVYRVYTQEEPPQLDSSLYDVIQIGETTLDVLSRSVRSAPAPHVPPAPQASPSPQVSSPLPRVQANSSSRLTIEESGSSNTLFQCDFGSDLCGCSNDMVTADFTWLRHTSFTPSDATGPNGDASSNGQGWYLYLEASLPRKPGDLARLTTPKIRSTSEAPVCLHFAYDMHGLNMGMLNVYVLLSLVQNYSRSEVENIPFSTPLVQFFGAGLGKPDAAAEYSNMTQRKFLLWSKLGEQRVWYEPPWENASITFYPYHDFQIIFEGVRGNDYTSDMAIDDVLITEGRCRDECIAGESRATCFNSRTSQMEDSCIPSEKSCDGRVDCPGGEDEVFCTSGIGEGCYIENNLENSNSNVFCWSGNPHGCAMGAAQNVRNILCNGNVDCFGGYDEANCSDIFQISATEATDVLSSNCGRHTMPSIDDLPSIPSSTNSWRWVAGLYLVAPNNNAQEVRDSRSSGTAYTFLCSAVLIERNWAVVPAHCILNPDTYDQYTDLQSFRGQETEESSDIEYDEFSRQNGPETSEEIEQDRTYEYVVKTFHPFLDGQQQISRRVIRIISHPNYTAGSDQVLSEVAKSNYDVALLKIEGVDDDLQERFISNPLNQNEEGYGSGFTNRTDDQQQAYACVELQRTVRTDETAIRSNPPLDGVFILPSERSRFDSTTRDERTPRKAYCVVVGHFLNTARNSPEVGWNLRHYKAFVSQAEVTAPNLYCQSLEDEEIRRRCQMSLSSSNSSFALNEVIRAGYQSENFATFVQDQGIALFCKRYDEKWFLSGILNRISLLGDAIAPNFNGIFERLRANVPFHATVGIRLGSDYFTKLTPTLNQWVSNVLTTVCPGEFSCYAAQSSKQKCIPNKDVCNGIIDCQDNYADEIDCDSGCHYDSNFDPVYQYYNGLSYCGVDHHHFDNENATTTNRTEKKSSWINLSDDESGVIRFNRIRGSRVRSCRWLINPVQGKVAVIRVPKLNFKPNEMAMEPRIIAGPGQQVLEWSTGPHYYTSMPGKPIAFIFSLGTGKSSLTKLRNQYFSFFSEDVGRCRDQHRCGDGSCVTPRRVCDGAKDCADYSDEEDCPSGCEGRSVYNNVLEGTLVSRNYPLSHNGNGDCLWIIDYTNDETTQYQINLHFNYFNTSSADKLYLYTGIGSSRKFYASFCNEISETNVTIPFNQATISLNSNDFILYRRFNISFTIAPIQFIK